MSIRGIQYLVDDLGEKTSVVIDLKRHGRLWEDLYDRMLAEARKGEARESLDEVKQLLSKKWKRRNA